VGQAKAGRPALGGIVSDTGIGLKKEDLEGIFSAFEQVENPASRRFQGDGSGKDISSNRLCLIRPAD